MLIRGLICFVLLATVPACHDQPAPPVASNPATAPSSESPAEKSDKPRSALQPATLSAEELADGWISLFDGQTLFGWQPANKADWKVENGVIVVTAGEKGLLCTTSQFADYVLKVDFRCPAGTNSGVFLRTPPKPTDPAKDCYELNIAPPDNPFPTGSFVKRKKVAGDHDSREWQSYEVSLNGAEVVVKLNGETILEYTDPEPLGRGHIGLQLNEGRCEFRNIRLKPLGSQSLFNGTDLTGWKTYPDFKTEFTVADGVLQAKNGPGQLETEKSYGDFVLQLEARTNGENLNSGVFFRCIPGEKMNGYECQIHNGFNGGDRTIPKDCGTGGIFRRQNARYVVANDKEWFFLTLVADGPHMAAWVNGMQVSDWTDDRQPDPNPRKGRRLDPGTIMLQGHDPTTDLSFRNFRLAEIR